MKTKLLVTVLALIATVAISNAQQGKNRGQGKGQVSKISFVDTNNDGICDNYNYMANANRKSKANVKNLRDGSGGIQKGKSYKQGRGKGNVNVNSNRRVFIDANNDGICDKRK
ncbi:hypothetical protein ACFLSA_02570 [Bacteroidota bacterium]